MKYDIIEIEKENIPYEFDIMLADEIFRLGIDYNETAEFFTIKLSKLNVETGEYIEICAGEPIIYGVPLWKDVYRSGKFPAVDIIPIDGSGENNAVTFDNLNYSVFLVLDNTVEEEEEAGREETVTVNDTTSTAPMSATELNELLAKRLSGVV